MNKNNQEALHLLLRKTDIIFDQTFHWSSEWKKSIIEKDESSIWKIIGHYQSKTSCRIFSLKIKTLFFLSKYNEASSWIYIFIQK